MTVKKQLSIEFLGAAKTVTGSRILVKYNGYQFLIDCGLFQGPKQIRIKNWEDFIDADKIHSVILTHAHIDHSGYLPKFVKEGFRGKVFASAGTVDLCKILLTDSAHLQEEDAKYLNKKRATHFHPAKPLYTVEDAEQAISLLVPVSKDEWHELTEGISFRLLRSGHILGSTFVQLSYTTGNGQKIITFSGDIGHDRQNVIKGPVIIKESDVLILEGTYGDRVQSKVDAADELEPIIKSTLNRGGVVVIPAFAVGRAQEILFLISKLEREKRIPSVPVYLDSPMSINATDIYMKYRDELRLTFNGDHFDYPLCPQQFQAVRSVDESMLVTMQDGPFIVVSAAGMLTGGRILHHLRKRLQEAKNSIKRKFKIDRQ